MAEVKGIVNRLRTALGSLFALPGPRRRTSTPEPLQIHLDCNALPVDQLADLLSCIDRLYRRLFAVALVEDLDRHLDSGERRDWAWLSAADALLKGSRDDHLVVHDISTSGSVEIRVAPKRSVHADEEKAESEPPGGPAVTAILGSILGQVSDSGAVSFGQVVSHLQPGSHSGPEGALPEPAGRETRLLAQKLESLPDDLQQVLEVDLQDFVSLTRDAESVRFAQAGDSSPK
jgi:hypothetical protein